MRYAFLFALLGAAAVAAAAVSGDIAAGMRLLLAWCGVDFLLIAIAYGRLGSGVFGKRPDGRLSPWAVAVFAPYLLLNHLTLALTRRPRRNHPPYDEIAPGVYLGPRLLPWDVKRASDFGAVLDLAVEFPEAGFLLRRPGLDYQFLPLLDTRAPSVSDLAEAVCWLSRQREGGKLVYIHCALGHGRSATVAAAYLLDCGAAADADGAVSLVTARRPGVRLHPFQWEALKAYGAARSREHRAPQRRPKPSPENLVAGVTERNRHPEVDTGGTVGEEAWRVTRSSRPR